MEIQEKHCNTPISYAKQNTLEQEHYLDLAAAVLHYSLVRNRFPAGRGKEIIFNIQY
jgi:hypothetical protein